MSYRIAERRPPKPNRTWQKTTTPGRIYIANGTTARLAIPCWYWEPRHPVHVFPHNQMMHDHKGWPSPSHPDRTCQHWEVDHCRKSHKHCSCECRDFIDMRRLWPIHLRAEGYNKAYVAIKDEPQGLSWTATINADDDWVINVDFNVSLESAVTEEQRIPFTVFITDGTRRDIAARGTLIIVPGPWEE